LFRTLMVALGWCLFVPGLILPPLPPPFAFGLFMMLPGLVILVIYSASVRRNLKRLRKRFHGVNIAVLMIEKRAPAKMKRILRTTRPKRPAPPPAGPPVSANADADIVS